MCYLQPFKHYSMRHYSQSVQVCIVPDIHLLLHQWTHRVSIKFLQMMMRMGDMRVWIYLQHHLGDMCLIRCLHTILTVLAVRAGTQLPWSHDHLLPFPLVVIQCTCLILNRDHVKCPQLMTPSPMGDVQVHTPPPAPQPYCTYYGVHGPWWDDRILLTPERGQTSEPPGFYCFASPTQRQYSPSPPARQTPFYSVSAPRCSGRQRHPVIQPFNVYGDEAPVDTLH